MPDPDMEILSQMLKPSAFAELKGERNKPRVVLTEPQDPKSSATISGLPSDALIVRLDAFNCLNRVFKGQHGECKCADYVIISEKKKRIICIELKRTKDAWSQIVRQLHGAHCIVRYCQEVGMTFWNKKDFLNGYEYRFVSIGHSGVSKQPSRTIKKAGRHDTPALAMKIDWPKNIHFNELV